MMTPRNWFIVGLRLFGIWQLTETIGDLMGLFTVIAGLHRMTTGTPGWYMVAALVHFGLPCGS
jgi:hypothetical protein